MPCPVRLVGWTMTKFTSRAATLTRTQMRPLHPIRASLPSRRSDTLQLPWKGTLPFYPPCPPVTLDTEGALHLDCVLKELSATCSLGVCNFRERRVAVTSLILQMGNE